MVLSYRVGVYEELMRAQLNTWDSVQHEGVSVWYYYGVEGDDGPLLQRDGSYFLCTNETDEYYFMASKFRAALGVVLSHGEFDLIFRTNSSSYVNKKNLVEYARKNLGTSGVYSGWRLDGTSGPDSVSGAGIFMSRDAAETLYREIDPAKEIEEDVYIGDILHRHGFAIRDDRSRVDYPQQLHKDPRAAYHIRFKTSDRLCDCENMKLVHKQILLGA